MSSFNKQGIIIQISKQTLCEVFRLHVSVSWNIDALYSWNEDAEQQRQMGLCLVKKLPPSFCFFLPWSRLWDGEVWVETLTQSTWASEPRACWPPLLRFPSGSLETGSQFKYNTEAHRHNPRTSCSHSVHLDCNLYLRCILLPPKQVISLLSICLAHIIPYRGCKRPAQAG